MRSINEIELKQTSSADVVALRLTQEAGLGDTSSKLQVHVGSGTVTYIHMSQSSPVKYKYNGAISNIFS